MRRRSRRGRARHHLGRERGRRRAFSPNASAQLLRSATWRARRIGTTIDLVLDRYGKLDVLVNNAAVSRSQAERDLLEDYRAIQRVN